MDKDINTKVSTIKCKTKQIQAKQCKKNKEFKLTLKQINENTCITKKFSLKYKI